MQDVKILWDGDAEDSFYIEAEGNCVAEMMVGREENILKVYHTDVLDPAWEGKGLGRALFQAMAAHARENGLKVEPKCPYVISVFERFPEEYKDIWLSPPSVS